MFFPPQCLEAMGFFCHKAPFVGRVKNAFEDNRIPIRSILTVSTPRVNEFLNPMSVAQPWAAPLPDYLRPAQFSYKKELST
jgi:hypothetical protein